MYAFQARLPINYVLELVKNIRSAEYDRGDNLLLVGAISGEIGALLKSGPFPLMASDEDDVPASIHGCVAALDAMSVEDPQAMQSINPSIWIPIVLKLIELWLQRQGK